MQKEHSRSEYERRMHRVLAYIDGHLDAPLDLAKLAEVAHFSPFHFHRLFAAWMGETLGEYLRRRRVEVAAMRLAAQPRVPILSVALDVGFGSAEAFSRAFRNRFGSSPSAWRAAQVQLRRQLRHASQLNSNPNQVSGDTFMEHTTSRNHHREVDMFTTMQVTLIERKPVTIAYLRHVGPYGQAIADFWQRTYVPWAITNRLGPDHARYGISYDDPSITDPSQCRYDACAEVADDFIPTGGALKTTLPGGRYAVVSFYGSVDQIAATWATLLRDWLPASGLQLDARPSFEYYPKGAKYNPETGEFACEICIPVAPL